ncbi:MAG: rhodanese-like domain-containing protein [Arachnia sp.]
MFRMLSRLLAAPILFLALSGCTDGNSDGITVSDSTVIIDVRTAEEFATGHLDGARLLDLTSGEFAATLPELAPDVEYLVYCRSGNRSAQAVTLMEDAGFSDVTNLGSVEQASSATGIPIVT